LDKLTNFILIAPILLFSMVAHEYAHGWVAYKNGDATAYQLGRLTWNPIKHIDPFMTVILPFMLFFAGLPILGGAKPVPVQPRNYRHFKKGDIMVSLAGVTANLIVAAVCTVVIPLVYGVALLAPSFASAASILQHMFIYGITINLVLAAFNLIPIPPLDGSHVMKYLLPPAWSLSYQRLGRYGLLILYAVLFLGGPLLTWWLFPADWLTKTLLKGVMHYIIPWPYPT
jgi:Zn-dependent protease